jgi:hypothetical protein
MRILPGSVPHTTALNAGASRHLEAKSFECRTPDERKLQPIAGQQSILARRKRSRPAKGPNGPSPNRRCHTAALASAENLAGASNGGALHVMHGEVPFSMRNA